MDPPQRLFVTVDGELEVGESPEINPNKAPTVVLPIPLSIDDRIEDEEGVTSPQDLRTEEELDEFQHDVAQPLVEQRQLVSESSSVFSAGRRLSSPATTRLKSFQKSLCTVPHFCTLNAEELNELNVMVREYDALDIILEAGAQIQHIYAIVQGSVEVFVEAQRLGINLGQKRVGSMTAPKLFGLGPVVLDQRSPFTMRAGSANTMLILVSKTQFLSLLQRSAVLAHSVSSKLVDHMDEFSVFQSFCRSVFSVSGVTRSDEGYTLNLPAILSCYRKLNNMIHTKLHDESLDCTAWKYAINRLPMNITETFVLNLARSLPPFLAKELRNTNTENMSLSFFEPQATQVSAVEFVPSQSRRRCAWIVGDRGHTLVLLREGFTDVLDFVTCFCIHMVESKKLRLKLQSMVSPSALDVLLEAMRFSCNLSDTDLREYQKSALNRLRLTQDEKDGILWMWPHSALSKLYNVLMHCEEYVVKIDTSLSRRFDIEPFLQWALSLRRHILEKVGNQALDGQLPSNLVIDLVSSNTHLAKNLLCSMGHNRRESLLEWAKTNMPEVVGQRWHNEDDKLYYMFTKWIRSSKELGDEWRELLRSCGFVIIEDTALTGLQVDIICVSQLRSDYVDPILAPLVKRQSAHKGNKHFIINMNYTFGAQADGITRALILTFGHLLRSVNVLGRAGNLIGKQGDITLPTQLVFSKAPFGEDTTDEFRSPGNKDFSIPRLNELCGPDVEIHTAPVVTMPGVILQSQHLLQYYHRVFGAIGLDMEASYFARQVEECISLELVRPDIATRYAFVTTHLPLLSADALRQSEEDFTSNMKPKRDVPPQYACARHLLEMLLANPGGTTSGTTVACT